MREALRGIGMGEGQVDGIMGMSVGLRGICPRTASQRAVDHADDAGLVVLRRAAAADLTTGCEFDPRIQFMMP